MILRSVILSSRSLFPTAALFTATRSPQKGWHQVRSLFQLHTCCAKRDDQQKVIKVNSIRFHPQTTQNMSLSTKCSLLVDHFPRQDITSPSSRSIEDTPLVVILPFLGAKPRHIQKYAELYHRKGYDCISKVVSHGSFLWPMNSYAVIDELCEALRGEEYKQRPLIIHSFSVGSYLLAVFFSRIIDEPERYADVSGRIVGLVADSITIGSPTNMAIGVSKTIAQSTAAQSLVVGTLMTYFTFTRPWTVTLYEKFIEAFTRYPIAQAPLLYFYSHDDPMCHVPSIEKLIADQKEHGYHILAKDWPDSVHAQHLTRHPIEYENMVNQLLRLIDSENSLLFRSKL